MPDKRLSDERFNLWDKRLRDILLFAVGVGGVINELWVQSEPRPYALIFLGSILGVPFVLRADEKRKAKDAGGEDPPQ